MRLANLENRPVLLEAGGAIDLVHASDGAFSTDFLDVYSRWEEVRAFAASTTASPRRTIRPASVRPFRCPARPSASGSTTGTTPRKRG